MIGNQIHPKIFAICSHIRVVLMMLLLYPSDSAGWSKQVQFRTPPAGGSKELKFLAFGDMGKAPLDDSVEHYIQVTIHSIEWKIAFLKGTSKRCYPNWIKIGFPWNIISTAHSSELTEVAQNKLFVRIQTPDYWGILKCDYLWFYSQDQSQWQRHCWMM